MAASASSPAAAVEGAVAAAAASAVELSAAAAAAAPDVEMDGVKKAAKTSGYDILGSIQALKEQQKKLRDERKLIAKQLKNEEKRRSRLRKKARQLSDQDLVALLKMRSDVQEAGASVEGSEAGSASGASSSG